MLSSNSTGIRERNRVAREIICAERTVTGSFDDVFIGDQEVGKAHVLGSFNSWNDEAAGAIRLGHVDGNAQVDVRRVDRDGFSVYLVVEHVLARELLEGLNHRPGDQVSEGNFSASRPTKVVIDHDPVVDHQLCGHSSNTRGRGHGEGLVHVGSERLSHALEGVYLIDGRFVDPHFSFGHNGRGRGRCLRGNRLFFGRNGGGFRYGGRHRRRVIGKRCRGRWGSRGWGKRHARA